MPAAIAMTPKRMETAYTVVSSMRKTMRLMISQRIPAIMKTHQALDTIRGVDRVVVGRFAHDPSFARRLADLTTICGWGCRIAARGEAGRHMLAIHCEGRRETGIAGGTARKQLAAAGRAGGRQLVLRLLEVPLGGAAAQADGHPVAEHLAALLAQPVCGALPMSMTLDVTVRNGRDCPPDMAVRAHE